MQLDVEVTHAQLAPADLTGGGEYLGQRVVEHPLEVLDVLLLARPAELAPPLRAIVLELLLRRFAGRRLGDDLGAQLDHPPPDLGHRRVPRTRTRAH